MTWSQKIEAQIANCASPARGETVYHRMIHNQAPNRATDHRSAKKAQRRGDGQC